MRDRRRSERVPLITTSWDDGHPLDLRLAAMLAAHGVRGTFYVPVERAGFPVITGGQMRSLRRMGMEVGSHTVTHAVLTRLDRRRALEELTSSKARLEDCLGEPVTSFCYPRGKFNRRVRGWAAEAGYRSARTTVAFRTETTFHPLSMPVVVADIPSLSAGSFSPCPQRGELARPRKLGYSLERGDGPRGVGGPDARLHPQEWGSPSPVGTFVGNRTPRPMGNGRKSVGLD